ncbi:hypothetical protein BSKO_04887 [Bryopsis sp. KO-2023]|nr:hypothetical protein BSKO_04887 [Bryopsis sp. KO-2023]
MAFSANTREKLVHPLTEVRQRALGGLKSKLISGIASSSSLARDETLLKNLSYALQNDCPMEETMASLEVIQHLLQHSGAKIICGRLGLETLLRQMGASHPQLQTLRENVLRMLLACPQENHTNHQRDLEDDRPKEERRNVGRVDICSKDRPRPRISTEETEMRFQLRAEWRQNSNPGNQTWKSRDEDGRTYSRGGPLRRIHVNAADDQHLFQLSVRLRFGEDPRVILPALHELSESILVDFPPQAFLQQKALMEGILGLVKSNSGASPLVRLTLKLLQKLAAGILGALDLVIDTDLHTHGGPPSHDTLESNLHNAYIWRSHPMPPPSPENQKRNSCGILGVFDEEEDLVGLEVGTYVIWIADHVFPLLRDAELHVEAVPLAEDLFAILLHPACLEFYSGVHPNAEKCLAELSDSITMSVTRATAAHKIRHQQEFDNETMVSNGQDAFVVLDIPSVNLMNMSIRLVELLDIHQASSLVPKSLLSILGDLSGDEFLSEIVPDLRPTMLFRLHQCAPHIHGLLSKADTVNVATRHADSVVRETRGLFDRSASLPQWLESARNGLEGIKWMTGDRFLRAVVCGLVLCKLRDDVSEEDAEQLKWLAVDVLSNHGTRITREAFLILLNMVQNDENAIVRKGSIALVSTPEILGLIITELLPKPSLKEMVASMINALVESRSDICIAGLARWDWLLQCYEDDPMVGPAASAFHAQHFDAMESRGASEWMKLQHSLRELYSVHSARRETAASDMWQEVSSEMEDACSFEADPFGGFLDGQGNFESQVDAVLVTNASFTKRDTENLVSVALNPALDQGLRKSAIEHLGIIAKQSSLLQHLCNPQLLAALFEEIFTGVSAGSSLEHGLLLVLASLSTLKEICLKSQDARMVIYRDADRTVVPLLPLIFHPLLSLKKALCGMLGALLFPPVSATSINHVTDGKSLGPLKRNFYVHHMMSGEETLQDTSHVPEVEEDFTDQDLAITKILKDRGHLSKRSPYQMFQTMSSESDIDHWTKATLINIYAPFEPGTIQTRLMESGDDDFLDCVRQLRSRGLSDSTGKALSGLCIEGGWTVANIALESVLANVPDSINEHIRSIEVLEWVQDLATQELPKEVLLSLLGQLRNAVVPILTADNAGCAIPNLPVAQTSFHGSALTSIRDRFWALCTTSSFLETLGTVIECARKSLKTSGELWGMLDGVGLEDAVDIISAGFVLKEGCDYGCRVKGMRVLKGLACLADGASKWNEMAKEPLLPPEDIALLTHPMGPIIRCIFMSNARLHSDGLYRQKGLAREALRYLDHLMSGMHISEWGHAWEDIAGVAWISRLSRDHEANVRVAALKIFTHVASDPTGRTLAVLLKGWPESLNRMADVACNACECDGVRAASMQIICQVIALCQDQGHADDIMPEACDAMQAFLISIPQMHEFWEMVSDVIRNKASSPALLSPSIGLMLQAVLSPFRAAVSLLSDRQTIESLMLAASPLSNHNPEHSESSSPMQVSVRWSAAVLLSFLVQDKEGLVWASRISVLSNILASLGQLLVVHETKERNVEQEVAIQDAITYTALSGHSISQGICCDDGPAGLVESIAALSDGNACPLGFAICEVIPHIPLEGQTALCALLGTLSSSRHSYAILSNAAHDVEDGLGVCIFTALRDFMDESDHGRDLRHAATAALRNVLTHSIGAKQAACETGFHGNLVEKHHKLMDAARLSGSETQKCGGSGSLKKGQPSKLRGKKKTKAALKAGKLLDKACEVEICSCLALLRHFVAHSIQAKLATLSAGVISELSDGWPVISGSVACMHEALSLISNLSCGCKEGTAEIASKGGSKSLLARMIAELGGYEVANSNSTSLATLKTLKVFSATPDGAGALVRSGFVETGRDVMKRAISTKDTDLLVATMQVFVNVAAFPDGQIFLMKPPAVSNLLELVMHGISPHQVAKVKTAAVSILRNLAFVPNFCHHLLAQSHSIRGLVKMATAIQEDENVPAAANAASALWALLSQGEKVKAALRNVAGWEEAITSTIQGVAAMQPTEMPYGSHDQLLQSLSGLKEVMEPFFQEN